ncbi:hypothetical protein [Pengzhenrongella sicca]|uniref:Uncharacterized protein n=1 Tax=Pengzhenrongella sicca TaxID=2819238 RepID=A0A8A4ZJ44_9MICO|nr:hypothetical protein [Pengzhenrongella sicca]QTE30989.1 hypothetical protein J4E96_08725 [Pengzhenrongella sicca]
MGSGPALGIGDLVVLGGRGRDVWEIVTVRHEVARVVARSVHLEHGRLRSVPLAQLARYDHDHDRADGDTP